MKNQLKTPSTNSDGAFYAESILIDEGGVELFVNGEIELGASFEALDNFEVAYRVLPEDFEPHDESYMRYEGELARDYCSEDDLEASIWVFSQELAKRRGYAK